MAKIGKRYPLVIYTRMLNRWWPAVVLLGLALTALAWPLYRDPFMRLAQPWRWQGMAGLGGAVILSGLMIFALRKSAYVQPREDHLRLATPFLRLKISYRRLRRTATANMWALFPPKSMRGWKREIVEPLGKMTAVVVELSAYPMPPAALQFFLSPLFFKDKTPHFVILVDNWMGFSTELESMRANVDAPVQSRTQDDRPLLSRLPRK
jgi:hypothetical protein